MFELWGKKRPVNNTGFKYEKICSFDNEENMYYMLGLIDKNIYQEAMIIGDNDRCYAFIEYEKPLTLNLQKDE